MKVTIYEVTEQSVSPEGIRYCTANPASYPTLKLARAAFAAEAGAAELTVRKLNFDRNDFCLLLDGNREGVLAGTRVTKVIAQK